MQLNIANLTYTYPSSAEPALCRVSATLPQGWTGIVGDNGSGKTVLLKLICGFMKPDSGTVTVNGQDRDRERSQVQDL